MKTKYLAIYIALCLLIIGSFFPTNKISAQEADIQYPIEELGNCESEADCKIYCDKPDNIDACLNFAQENNLMSDEEIAQAKRFLAAGDNGPGGCTGKDSCEQYCNDIDHIDECISYAEENDLMSPSELEEAKKVQSAINKGVKPPQCGNKKECDIYCEDPDHMEECITFGVAAGFIQGKELEDVQKMLQALKRGVKPLPCKGKDACDEYCNNPDNMEMCINFAIEAGMMSEQEKADSQKMLQALKKGVKPPPCKGKEECDEYCQQEDHFKECTDFAVAAGFMSEKDAEMARKTGGKGPGDCKNKEECDAFCNNPDNQENCFNFAKDNGMIPEEDLKRMEEGKQQMKQMLGQASAEVLDCLKLELGADMVEKMMNGFMPPRESGDKMQTCFQKMGPPPGSEGGGPGEGGMIPPAGQTGPGGCKTAEECKAYCESNSQECQNFQSPANQNPGQQMQPGQPCQGENCQNGPSSGNQPEGQMQPGQPCEGENCQYAPGTQPGQPGQQISPQSCQGENCPPPGDQSGQPGQQPSPPSSDPGSGGNLTPGEFVPPVQPIEQQTPPPASPAPGSLLQSIINFFINIF